MNRASRPLLHGILRFPTGSSHLVAGRDIHPLIPVNAKFFDAAKLRKQLDDDGYLYFKNIIPEQVLQKALFSVVDQMLANKWTTEEDLDHYNSNRDGLMMGIPFPGSSKPLFRPEALPPPTAGFSMTPEIQEAISGTNVMATVRQVFGGLVECLPHRSLELSAPNEAHGFHMDSVYMNRGSKLMLTAWVPLHHTPMSMGGICIARGSNSSPCYESIRKTYGMIDVETAGIHGDGCYTNDCGELLQLGKVKRFDPDTSSVSVFDDTPLSTASFQAGDVVLMTVYTMHSFLTNSTRFWRCSGDTKWLMEGDDVGPDPRFTATGEGLASWYRLREDRNKFPKSMEEAKKEWAGAAADTSKK